MKVTFIVRNILAFPSAKFHKVVLCTSRNSYQAVLLMRVKEIVRLASTICEISSLLHQ